MRNNLTNYSFRYGEHVASWEDIEVVHSRDLALQIRPAPKLNEKHIRPNNFNKMKVKLATQVLSHTVTALKSTKVLKCALCDHTNRQDFMKEPIGFMKGLKVFNGNEEVKGRTKCLKGWVMTVNAIPILIWEHLKKTRDFKFLLTRRLNPDPIENFLGTITQKGGNSDNPTPSQFT